jgi:hypothetical protein
MCEYCSLNKNFWDQVVEGAKRITVLTPEQVEQLYRDNPELRQKDGDGK